MSEKKRVLIFVDRWASGGIESFIVTFLENVPTKEFDFTIVTSTKESSLYDERLLKLDVDFVTLLDEFSEWYIRPFKMVMRFKEYIRNNNFDVYHFHIYNAISLLFPAIVDRKNKIIIHSHNADVAHDKTRLIKLTFHKLARLFLIRKHYRLLGVSSLAGYWMFGSRDFTVVNNGINSTKFSFSPEIRRDYREKFGFDEDSIVLLNVGRLNEQKNQKLFISIFKELQHKYGENLKGIIVGDGPLKDRLLEDRKKLDLEDNIMFLNQRNDIPQIASMSDVFILPSIYEGLPLVGVEMQNNGIICLFSNNIDHSVKILNNSSFFNISDNVENISQEVVKAINKNELKDRTVATQIIKNQGFDISNTVSKILEVYRAK